MSSHRTFRIATLAAASVLAIAAAQAADSPAPGSEPQSLEKMDPSVPTPLAAHIVANDHPMGSQIRLHEGNGLPSFSTRDFTAAVGSVAGMDVSGYQGNVDWSAAHANGARFAYVKATEGIDYINPYFAQQYDGSYQAGMIRGAYHFAHPDSTTGTAQAQAQYFFKNGGAWSADGKTLPGALDLEYDPYGSDACYGLSQADMAAWISSFSNKYYELSGRYPVIYTSTGWWTQCVGRSGNFSATSPLWIARDASTVGTLPYAWRYYTFWQYADSGIFPGDQNLFNGAYTQLVAIARG